MTVNRSLLPACLVLTLISASAAQAHAQAPPAAGPFEGLRFLIGHWRGLGSGKPGEGTGAFSLTEELEGKVLIRRSVAEYPAKPGETGGARHEDLMIVYPIGSSLKASYFDSEGHVIHYTVTTTAGSATFESDGLPEAPRFKLLYEARDKDVALTFSIAPPGRTYQPYLSAVLQRQP